MLCAFPIGARTTLNGSEFRYSHPCGRCMPCRINRANEWTGRILLEALHWGFEKCSFVTLTYSDECLPEDRSVNVDVLQRFLKRVRTGLSRSVGGTFRYYAVGEYGRRSWREHYHIIFFGIPADFISRVEPKRNGEYYKLLVKEWREPDSVGVCAESLGFVHVMPMESTRARYIAKYTTMKQVGGGVYEDYQGREDHPLNGRATAFMRCSKGIGLSAVPAFVRTFKKYGFAEDIELALDEHGFFRYAGEKYRLDRYMRDQIIKFAGSEVAPLLTRLRRLDDAERAKLGNVEDMAAREESGRRAHSEIRRDKLTRPV